MSWSQAHSFVILFAVALCFLSNRIELLILPGIASFLYYFFTHRFYLSQLKPFGGYANAVTFVRLLIICVAGLFYSTWLNEYLFVCFTTAVLFDVLDGYLARKYKQSSDFGLYLDMETDAFFVALISTVLFFKGLLEMWLLFPAYLRYLYMVFLNLIPIQQKKEPKRSYASIIAGCFFVVLLLPLILPEFLYQWPLRICGLLIMGSFAVSLKFQLTTQKPEDDKADKKNVVGHRNNP